MNRLSQEDRVRESTRSEIEYAKRWASRSHTLNEYQLNRQKKKKAGNFLATDFQT